MPTRNVVLTEHQSSLIEGLIGSGRYQNASEVLREGLRLVEQRERHEKARLEGLRQAVAVGITDIEAGHYTTLDSPTKIRNHITTLANQRAKGQAICTCSLSEHQ